MHEILIGVGLGFYYSHLEKYLCCVLKYEKLKIQKNNSDINFYIAFTEKELECLMVLGIIKCNNSKSYCMTDGPYLINYNKTFKDNLANMTKIFEMLDD